MRGRRVRLAVVRTPPQRAYLFWYTVGNRILGLLKTLFNTTLEDHVAGRLNAIRVLLAVRLRG